MSTQEPIDFDGASIPVLAELLLAEEAALRADAACALGDRIRANEQDELERPVHEALAALLRDRDPAVRFEAAIALAELQDHRATDVLLRALHNGRVRLDATRALGTLGDRRAIPHLLRLMKRRLCPWADKLQASAALCALGNSIGSKFLADKTRSRRRAERAAALHFLGESRHPGALGLLTEVLLGHEDSMQDVAARALGLNGDSRAIPPLTRARDGASEELRQDIDASLAMLQR